MLTDIVVPIDAPRRLSPNGDYPLSAAVNAFFALDAEDQAQLLALQPSDTGIATLTTQGGDGGGPSDSAAVMEQLRCEEDCHVPSGREADAELFLRVLDANAFQCACRLSSARTPSFHPRACMCS
jgi:hypothetical protein